ncbi:MULTISPECIES: acetyl-CoA carboxylase biotin carboxylase subunit [unclassified Leptotrichia]|jgi:acetyl-coA carboxylase, biotin carboxylase subunit|uniref:acetyl-CoA carboxylase biotin carboxylase subunit n=1 Tax=unclassified Leptotrichia TaxID=2633022 RepID=UPI001836E7A2|nr:MULTISPECIES: acetyl-CoA carboxylase biotin carboxylase subunit [unclassified Leptotrichia]MBB1534812.1 acetyl-CoA carboxylase biotin carboxylase subunit [Leptotrichia sp.]QUB97344.1 acetyl-CoA carboxylase biotin carboxylase subunit [Leptotrichia sp. oral taxon 221]
MFKKILIANRGEIAVRIIRAARELGISTVAVYSEADADSLHVALADEAICIGPASSSESYLKIPNIISAAQITGAEAIHPGYGFLSENASFAKICTQNNIVFIGPKPELINMMGDKATARETAIKHKVPITKGSDGIVPNVEEAKKVAKWITYPVMIKATAGGGGKGMRIAHDEKELAENYVVAQNEAKANFGNPDVYIEKYVEEPRHVEIQVIGDKFGNVAHLGERDCSIQRRNQKLVEETPSPGIDAKTREKMGKFAAKLAKGIGYDSVGTLEFLVDKSMNFYFMEMNTRIQVEHTISEEITGVDLVKEQIRVAAGEKLSFTQKDIEIRGHVIECRINAEDSENGFLPSSGVLEKYIPSGGIGVRVDSHSYQNYEIPPYYDSMIAKLIVKGKNREEAIARMKRALKEFKIEGVDTTIPFHLKVLENEAFKEGKFYTNFIETYFKEVLK